MKILKEGHVLIDHNGAMTIEGFTVKGGTTEELKSELLRRVLLAASTIRRV